MREPDGALLVLEDNLRTPSGLAYALAARHAVAEAPSGCDAARAGAAAFTLLGDALRAAAPAGAGEEPAVVVLTDGPANAAHWEHARAGAPARRAARAPRRPRAARRPSSSCATTAARGRRRLPAHRRGPRCATTDGALTAGRQRSCSSRWPPGALGVVNAFGTGVADDKLVHAYVEDMVRFYLGEEPLVRSVPTLDLGDPRRAAEAVLDRLAELVVKPRGATAATASSSAGTPRRRTCARVRRPTCAPTPGGHVAQETVTLSRRTRPSSATGRLEPRHVDLRPFASRGGDGARGCPAA